MEGRVAAGVPNSAAPFLADQAFWARQVYRLGVGPLAPPARHLKREAAAALIQTALTDPAYLRRAERLAEELRGEDGIAAAVNVIGGHLGGL